MCSLQNERLFDIPVMKTASFAMKRVNSDGKCYKAEVSEKELGANRQDAISDENMGNPYSPPPFTS